MGAWDDYAYYEEEAAKEAFIDDTLRGISEDGVRSYLGQYGDAVDERVLNCIRQAKELQDTGFFQPAVVSATTAIELIVRFLLIHPLIQAAFLSEEWAYLLTQRIASGRTAEDRKLLPKILEHHRIDITAVLLENGDELWETVVSKVYPKRNRIVHAAEPSNPEEAQLAIECATRLRSDIVLPIAERLGFTLVATGFWCRSKTANSGAYFTPRNPFSGESTASS
jgi:hypothetical protein